MEDSADWDHEDPWIRMRIRVKWDGCVDINRFYSGDKADADYLHICDLNEFIGVLTAMRDQARDRFGKDWGR